MGTSSKRNNGVIERYIDYILVDRMGVNNKCECRGSGNFGKSMSFRQKRGMQ